jgi:hypothetical protein
MSMFGGVPQLNLSVAEFELADFRSWLVQTPYFKEKDVIGKLKSLATLSPLMGMYDGRRYPTVQKFEFEIQVVFRADFVAGVPAKQHFIFVEFEGGEKSSIFGPGRTNQMRDWGKQIQRGFSQIADWSWAKNESQHSRIYRSAFGVDESHETYVLVCGRDSSLVDHERARLLWRNSKTSIANCGALFQTYDDLVEHFESALDAYRSFSA